MKIDCANYCIENYGKRFLDIYSPLKNELEESLSKGEIKKTSIPKKLKELNALAQKQSIMETTIDAIRKFPEVKPSLIWKSIYSAHVHRYSEIHDERTIKNVISADQSWKKSSGHAFEEIIKHISSNMLKEDRIEIVLQRDLTELIKNNQLTNEPRDLKWLEDKIKSNAFDLYAIYTEGDKKDCYGCVQSKTSIRDRVTRDREPSQDAMNAYFWSVAIVLDGEFLKNKKFISMVNGGSSDYKENGWHGLYVFSERQINDRIYPTDINMINFKEHAKEAAEHWKTQRQWFKHDWKAKTEINLN